MRMETLHERPNSLTPQTKFVIKCTPPDELKEMFWHLKNIGEVNEYCEFLAREYPDLYAMDED